MNKKDITQMINEEIKKSITKLYLLIQQKLSDQDPFLGIDFGSTSSSIAIIDADTNNPVIVSNTDNQNQTPSVIYFKDVNEYIVGAEAIENIELFPDNIVLNIKMHLNNPTYFVTYKDIIHNVYDICSYIFKHLIIDTEQVLGIKMENVVIAIPAYFSMNEEKAILSAARIAGLNCIHLLKDPVAAVFSRGHGMITQDQVLIVYDLGGAKFECSILKIKDKKISIICSSYSLELGGQAWDQIIVDHFANELAQSAKAEKDKILSNKTTLNQLMIKSEMIKKDLTLKSIVHVDLMHNNIKFEFTYSRDQFIKQTQHLLSKTVNMTLDLCKEANSQGYPNIDRIIVVGGASKMPQVVQTLKETFQMDIYFKSPEYAIACGAASYAHENFGNRTIISHKPPFFHTINSLKSEIFQSIKTLQAQFEQISKKFQSKIQYDKSKDKMIDKLHAELQQYKDGLLFQLLKPIVTDFIHLHDDFGKMIRHNQENNPGNTDLIDCLLNYQESIEDILYDHGFEVYETDNDIVNPKLQQITQTFPTSQPEMSKKIKDRLRKGFKFEDTIVRREFVSTFLFENNNKNNKGK